MIVNKPTEWDIEKMFNTFAREAREKAEKEFSIRLDIANKIEELLDNIDESIIGDDLELRYLKDEYFVRQRTKEYISNETRRHLFKNKNMHISDKKTFVKEYLSDLSMFSEEDNIVYITGCDLEISFNRAHPISLVRLFRFLNKHSELNMPTSTEALNPPIQLNTEYDLGNATFIVDTRGRRVKITIKETKEEK